MTHQLVSALKQLYLQHNQNEQGLIMNEQVMKERLLFSLEDGF